MTEAAPAKVNLFLHLRGQRADGYHLLESLAVFPAIGDVLAAEPGPGLSLAIDGPFAAALPAGGDNLVLRAAAALAAATGVKRPGAALRLVKSLPVASGIGGGSSDAAATLRLLARHWGVAVPEGLALQLGADVPVCLRAPRATLMAGVGERLAPAPALPGFWMVLVNPLRAVETRAVFGATARKDLPPGPAAPAGGLAGFDALVDWLGAQRNDLEPAARLLCPAIGEVLAALSDAPLARMSGSGATCFALHHDAATALPQAARIRAAAPGWWVAAAPVTG
ncbi:MAG: 4-(cytidine 5'-diphospho)-2-C-methyl-D-erythritol kinase [Thermohalobaculum sp.]|nr:4-(cytidine 5'-diphospho)-2-C-methyl-D-erythritol kinase [Thermohalobaculum sp.]